MIFARMASAGFAARLAAKAGKLAAAEDHAGKLACHQPGGWILTAPRDGMRLLDRSTGQDIRYHDGWHRAAAPAEPTGGATVDAEARTAIAGLIAALVAGGMLAGA